jgi:hypothetical protein
MVEVQLDRIDGKDPATIAAELAVKKSKRSPEKMAQAQVEIILRVEDGQLAHLCDRDPSVIWDTLQSVHQAHGFATSLALRCWFLTAKKREDESMQSWIGSICQQAFILMQEAGVATTSQDMILVVTMGLPPTYDTIIINFNSTSPDQLTFENVVAWLINEETCQSSTEEAIKTAQNNAALAATHRCDGCDPRCELICHFCEKPGHFKSECP